MEKSRNASAGHAVQLSSAWADLRIQVLVTQHARQYQPSLYFTERFRGKS